MISARQYSTGSIIIWVDHQRIGWILRDGRASVITAEPRMDLGSPIEVDEDWLSWLHRGVIPPSLLDPAPPDARSDYRSH